jgi:hypothetical protein
VESLIFGFFSLYVFVLGVAGISGAGWGGGSVIRHVLLSCDIFIIPVAVRLLSKLDSTVDGECPPFFYDVLSYAPYQRFVKCGVDLRCLLGACWSFRQLVFEAYGNEISRWGGNLSRK